MKKIACLFLIVLASCNSKTTTKDNQQLPSDSISFTFTEFNNISIPAIINEVDTLDLMFHTANSGISLTTSAIEKMNSFKADQTDTLSTWGGQAEERVSTGNDVQMGKQEWKDVTIFESQHSGHLTDGKFGPSLFIDQIIALDFEDQIMTLYDSLPEIENGFEKFEIKFQMGMMFLEGKIYAGEDTLENKFLIHSGYSGSILLDDEFVDKNGLGKKLTITSESELKDSFGNILKTKKATLPSFALGKFSFSNIEVGFFEGAIGRQKMSVMGGDVLKRFQIIFDIPNANIYLRPIQFFET